MNMKCVEFLIILLTFHIEVEMSDSLNILALWPVKSRANLNMGMIMFNKLAENGHKISVFSPFEIKTDENDQSIKHIKISKVANSVNVYTAFHMRNMSTYETLKLKIDMARDITDFVLGDEAIKQISNENHFDMMMLDYEMNEALLGVAVKLKIPAILFDASGNSKYIDYHLNNHQRSYSIPLDFLGYPDDMSFTQKISNSIWSEIDKYLFNHHHIPAQEALMKEYFSDVSNDLTMKSVMESVVDVFTNYHQVLHHPKVFAPKMTQIGGFHLGTLNSDQIHPEFTKTMDKAPNGIIYLSTGAVTKFADFPEHKLDIIISVLKSFEDILVLMKFESIALKEKHIKNAIVGPWLPQQEILNHPKLKIFITLGGPCSIMEALSYGKPIVGIPIDNGHNQIVKRVINRGLGVYIDFDNLTFESFKTAIEEIYNNTKYDETAAAYANVFKTSLELNPLEKIVKKIEYLELIGKYPKNYFNLPEYSFVENYILIILTAFSIFSTFYILCLKLVNKRKHVSEISKTANKKKNK